MLTAAWALLTSRLAGPIAAGAALLLAALLGVTMVQKAAVTADRDRLFTSIETPKTGWRDRLATCNASVGTLEAGIEKRNDEITRLGQKADADLAAAQQSVESARRETAALNTRLNRLQSTPFKGASICERYDEADRAVLEMLK